MHLNRQAIDKEQEVIEMIEIYCPSCGEPFEVACPGFGELPADLDHDCEVCCRPMVIWVYEEEGEVVWEVRGLDD